MKCFCCNKRPATVRVGVGELAAQFCDECAKPILVKANAMLTSSAPKHPIVVERLQ